MYLRIKIGLEDGMLEKKVKRVIEKRSWIEKVEIEKMRIDRGVPGVKQKSVIHLNSCRNEQIFFLLSLSLLLSPFPI